MARWIGSGNVRLQPCGQLTNDLHHSIQFSDDKPVLLYEIAVVIDQNVSKSIERTGEILKRALVTIRDLTDGNIVATLGHAHGNAGGRLIGASNANVDEEDRVTRLLQFTQCLKLLSNRIGEYSLKNEALTLINKLLAIVFSEIGRSVRVHACYGCNHICVYE